MIEYAAVAIIRIAHAGLNSLPYNWRLALVTGLFRAAFLLLPRYRRIALRNLELAFPDQELRWRLDVFHASVSSLGRLLVDFLRIPELDRSWAENFVSFPQRERFMTIRRESKTGVILAAGHLGSFELLPVYMALTIAPMAVVIRDFKQSRIDGWWNGIRACRGNLLVSRRGALRQVLRALKHGTDVGILFDQNLTRQHAVFVDWFGRPAATTRAIGVAAVRLQAPVLLFGIFPDGPQRYRIQMQEFQFSEVLARDDLSLQEKTTAVTAEVVKGFENYVRQYPEGWFWIHRRWRTTSSPDLSENFYENC